MHALKGTSCEIDGTRWSLFAIAFGVRTRPRVAFWFPCIYDNDFGSLAPAGTTVPNLGRMPFAIGPLLARERAFASAADFFRRD